MKKIVLFVVVAVAAFLGWNQYSANESKDHIVVSGPFEFHGIDISKNGYMFSRLGVTQSLTHLSTDGQVEPLLATDWQQSDDGKQWRFTLRRNVYFHNGQTFSADDVVASLTRAMSKPGLIKKVPITSVNSDNGDVVITLSSAYRPLLATLAHFSLGIVSKDAIDQNGDITAMNATGPYKVETLVAPHKLTVQAFEKYWGSKPHITSIEYQAGHRSESRALQVQSGQADIAYSIDAISKQTLSSAKNVEVKSLSLPRTVMIKLNNTHPFLADVRVRQAMSLALDREGIASSILFSPDSAAYQLFSQSQGDWYVADVPKQRNLTLASELLIAAGWQKINQGWLEKDGQKFEVKLTTYADRPELPLIATAIQNQLAEVGISVVVSIDNSSVIPAGHNDNSLEMALIARNFGMAGTPLPILYQDFSRLKGSEWGHMNWYSADVERELSRLLVSDDAEEQTALTQDVARTLIEQLPVIPVAYSTQHIAVNKALKGLVFDPYEIDYRLENIQFND